APAPEQSPGIRAAAAAPSRESAAAGAAAKASPGAETAAEASVAAEPAATDPPSALEPDFVIAEADGPIELIEDSAEETAAPEPSIAAAEHKMPAPAEAASAEAAKQQDPDEALREIYARETSAHVATVRAYLQRESSA